jgi:hypothetical protein
MQEIGGRLMGQNWLLLHYKIPNKPTSSRVFVWRKLKRLGAILIHDAVWCLPSTPWTLEQFQWLSVEIKEFGGDAMVWESKILIPGQDGTLIEQFTEQVDTAYTEILNESQQDGADLMALSKRYQQVKLKDYFQSELGNQVRDALISEQGGMKS